MNVVDEVQIERFESTTKKMRIENIKTKIRLKKKVIKNHKTALAKLEEKLREIVE